jgi:hypothetical protein
MTEVGHAMPYLPFLVLHIAGGGLAILAGYGAVLAAKGARLHRMFGTMFVGAMMVMATLATGLAVALRHASSRQDANIAIGLFALYLVATGWAAVKRKPSTTGPFEKAALAVIVAVSATLLIWGAKAAASPHGFDGYGASLYFVFGGAAALAAALDMKVLLKGGVAGIERISRHLWRMCAAFFIAAGSFFLGQQKVMPVWMHGSPVLLGLALAPLGFMLFWLVRIRIGRRFKRRTAAARTRAKEKSHDHHVHAT